MTNLSSLPGFGAASSGGSGVSEYTGSFVLDAKSFDLTDESKSLQVTDLYNYAHPVRIRGFDTNTDAYMGFNCMVQNGAGGNMQHNFTMFTANQANGVITKQQCTTMHNNGSSTYDYSTFDSCTDEWTGRYTYHGHIPRNNSNHIYGYDQCFVTDVNGSKASSHTNSSTFYPAGNDRVSSAWLAPAERRHGGASRHFLASYASADSKARVLEFYYNYSTSQLNASRSWSAPFATSLTSTNWQVTLFNQWDVTNLPHYDAFHSFQEGLYAHNRSSDSWGNLGSAYGLSNGWSAFYLSNGGIFLSGGGSYYLITQGGQISTVSSTTVDAPMGLAKYNWANFCVNVGEDEWLLALPDASFMKFKINPTTGAVSSSNVVKVNELANIQYDQYFHYNRGLWSGFSTTTVIPSGQLFTFGNENTNGYGYGKSKMMYVGSSNQSRLINVATYDLTGLLAEFSY